MQRDDRDLNGEFTHWRAMDRRVRGWNVFRRRVPILTVGERDQGDELIRWFDEQMAKTVGERFDESMTPIEVLEPTSQLIRAA